MPSSTLRTLLALLPFTCLPFAACTHDVEDPGRHGLADDPSASADAVTCGASLARYPVAGAHNGGWDQNATHFSCGHPSWAPDNSDFYRGAGDANHADGHIGNDIFAARGTPVVAAAAGRVTYVGNDSVGGRNVIIRDGCGWSHYYAHLDAVDGDIWVGRDVAAGTRVGLLGDTGQARGTQPHLHFSVFPDGVYSAGIDPFPLLAAVDHTACDGGGGGGGGDACQGLDYAGECSGDRVRWCEDGALREKDCGDVGKVCAWQDDATGFNCLAAPDPAQMTCGDWASSAGYASPACEWNGNGACYGTGPRTADCDFCCDAAAFPANLPDPATNTCGTFAAAIGWSGASCEWNGNGACNGRGTPTSDCDRCCPQ